jgi:hypothetical protein
MAEQVAHVPDERPSLLARILHAPDEETAQGYAFWGPVVGAILIVEVLGAAGDWLKKHLSIDVHWPTISSTVGHLENRWTIVAALVVGLIGASAYLALAGDSDRKTSLGRTRLRAGPTRPLPFYTAAVPIVATIVAWVVARSITEEKLVVGYWIYGTLAVFGIVVPSLLLLAKAEVQFPTLFFTARRLQRHNHWVATALVASLAILVIHLALYPWPDITKEPTQYAGLDARQARGRAVRSIAELRAGKTPLKYSTQARGVDNGEDAWLVFFTAATTDAGGAYAGCVVSVRAEAVHPAAGCSE